MEIKPLTERERIDMLAFRLELSIRQFAKVVGISENTLYHITDNSRLGISQRTASKICYNLEKKMNVHVNRQWLLTGVGDVFLNGENVKPYVPAKEEVGAEAAESSIYDLDWREKYYNLLEEYSRLQKEHNELLKKQ